MPSLIPGWELELMSPLIKSSSKAAFRKNVAAEAKSKPIKQAVAIAYATQRAAAHKSKKK